MLVHHRVTPALNSLVPIYTLGWREALYTVRVKCLAQENNDTMSPATGLKPRPLNLELRALTVRPPHLPCQINNCYNKMAFNEELN